MSVKMMSAVYDSDLEKSVKAIALAYADHADDDGGSIYPATSRVSWKTGYSERQVRRATAQLKKMGVLKKAGTMESGVILYRMIAAKLPQRPPYDLWREENKKGGGDKMSGVTGCQGGGDKISPPPVEKGGDRVSPKPSYTNHHTNHHLSDSDESNKPDPQNLSVQELPEPSERRATMRNEVVADLEKAFSMLTRLPLPHRKTEKQQRSAAVRWWNPLWSMYELFGDIAQCKSAMNVAIHLMRADKLTIPAPASIESNVTSLYGEWRSSERPFDEWIAGRSDDQPGRNGVSNFHRDRTHELAKEEKFA